MGYVQGDTIVHPQHGAAVVDGIVTKDLGQGPTEYLELHVAAMTILVPVASLEDVGLRSPCSKQEAEAILALLESGSDVSTKWAERNASNLSRLKSKEPDQLAMVVRDLTRHQRRIGKPLNKGEQNALTTCLDLLAPELALALDMPVEETMSLLAERAAGHSDGADVRQEPPRPA